MESGLSARQWLELGTILRKIHSTQLPAEIIAQMQRETFSPKWSGVVRQLQANINAREVLDYANPFERELASIWKQKSAEVVSIVDQADALGHRLQQQSLDFVLCHTDIHTANILIDHQDQMHIVDWDTP